MMALAAINSSNNKHICYAIANFSIGLFLRFETENGIRQAEEGKLKRIGKDEKAIAALGNYEYSGPHGEIISVVYTADENGYRPKVNVRLLGAPGETRVPPALVASLVGG